MNKGQIILAFATFVSILVGSIVYYFYVIHKFTYSVFERVIDIREVYWRFVINYRTCLSESPIILINGTVYFTGKSINDLLNCLNKRGLSCEYSNCFKVDLNREICFLGLGIPAIPILNRTVIGVAYDIRNVSAKNGNTTIVLVDLNGVAFPVNTSCEGVVAVTTPENKTLFYIIHNCTFYGDNNIKYVRWSDKKPSVLTYLGKCSFRMRKVFVGGYPRWPSG